MAKSGVDAEIYTCNGKSLIWAFRSDKFNLWDAGLPSMEAFIGIRQLLQALFL